MERIMGSMGWLVGVVAGATCCGGPTHAPAPPAGPVSRARAPVAPPAVPAEHPLTPAKLMFVNELPESFLATGNPYADRAFPLATGGIGLLVQGARVAATVSEVRTIPDSVYLGELCVAKDGKTTFAVSSTRSNRGLYRADSFDGPLVRMGFNPVRMPGAGDPWVAIEDASTVVRVTCSTGSVERFTAPLVTSGDTTSWVIYWSNAIQLVRTDVSTSLSYESVPETTPHYGRCLLRTAKDAVWRKEPACQLEGIFEDGALRVESTAPAPAAPCDRRSGHPDDCHSSDPTPPMHCLFVLEPDGTQVSCSKRATPLRSYFQPPAPAPAWVQARFYAPSRTVVPGPQGGLYALSPEEGFDRARPVGAGDLQACTAVLPVAPLFVCARDRTRDVFVRVDTDGVAHEELERSHAASATVALRGIWVTPDGGVAVDGECGGGAEHAACARTSNGTWHTVTFSSELATALDRASAKQLVPTPDGRLIVSSFSMDDLLAGHGEIVLYDASGGPPAHVRTLPPWALERFSRLRDSGASVTWIGPRRIRAWPVQGEHVSSSHHESCSLDIGLDGTSETSCVEGSVYSVGRAALWEKQPGDVYETLDAGSTWARVTLPKGIDTNRIACFAVGCRIHPYWRMGW